MVLGPRLARLPAPVDAVVVSSLIDLAHLRQLSGPHTRVPFLLYMHENQFFYPRPPGQPLDRGFATAHLASFLAADAIGWNSRSHRRATEDAVRDDLEHFPEPRPRGVISRLRRGTKVLPPGVDLSGYPEPVIRPVSEPPVIAWNHRWDGDKRPSAFARTLFKLADKGKDFRLVLLGPSQQLRPEPLLAIRERLGERILVDGMAETREEYIAWLSRSDFAVSTASQENFGYAAVEAMAAGALPLLPRRLSYPELLPAALARELLYENDRDLVRILGAWLDGKNCYARVRHDVMRAARRHEWPCRAVSLDAWVSEVVSGS